MVWVSAIFRIDDKRSKHDYGYGKRYKRQQWAARRQNLCDNDQYPDKSDDQKDALALRPSSPALRRRINGHSPPSAILWMALKWRDLGCHQGAQGVHRPGVRGQFFSYRLNRWSAPYSPKVPKNVLILLTRVPASSICAVDSFESGSKVSSSNSLSAVKNPDVP